MIEDVRKLKIDDLVLVQKINEKSYVARVASCLPLRGNNVWQFPEQACCENCDHVVRCIPVNINSDWTFVNKEFLTKI